MSRLLITLLASLLVFAPLSAAQPDWSSVIDRAEKSVMFVGSGCTAFVIDATRKYVLTADHCDTGKTMWVDRVEGDVVAKDELKDLMVLEVKHLDPARPALRLAKGNPERGQNVMSIGYGMALERPFFRIAHVSDDAVTIPDVAGGPFIGLDAAFVGGQSGGPVVNHNGEVVMIVQRASNTIGIGIGADTIRERVGRFFGR